MTAKYYIKAADKAHFESLVKDFRKDFYCITYTGKIAEFEDLETKEITIIEC